MNFTNWRIVDVDHFMKGNSFFSKFISEDEFIMEKESAIGKIEDNTFDY